jgi:uncharacterized repeat protein (TIGR01451 family)
VTGTFNCPSSCGGGVLLGDGAQPDLINLRLMSNTAEYFGGGLYSSGHVILSGSVFSGNAAGYGGGLNASAGASVTNTRFTSNTVRFVGGGAFSSFGPVNVTNSHFESNRTTVDGSAAGLYSGGSATVTNSSFVSNSAVLGPGGMYIVGPAWVTGTTVVGNVGRLGGVGGARTFSTTTVTNATFAHNAGGGLSAASAVTVANSSFVSNTGRGVSAATAFVTGTLIAEHTDAGLSASGAITVINSTLMSNTTRWWGAGLAAGGPIWMVSSDVIGNSAQEGGGGLYSYGGSITLSNTQILSNSALFGGGLYATSAVVTLAGGEFEGNQAFYGGGLAATGAITVTGARLAGNAGNIGGGITAVTVTVSETQLTSNHALYQGGGLYASLSARLVNSRLISNVADDKGGGVYLTDPSAPVPGPMPWPTGPAAPMEEQADQRLLVNCLLVGNRAGNLGDGIYVDLWSAGVQILHTTIADLTLTEGAAIYVASGTAGITNTVVSQHAVGVERQEAEGSVFQDYNLFHANGQNLSGTVSTGGHSLTGDPRFANPAGQDYRLTAGSLAIDTGTPAGVPADFEGQPRPQGHGVDIGFDESLLAAEANVSLTKTAATGTPQPGQMLTYVIVYHNAGPDVAPGIRLTDIVPGNLSLVSYTSSGASVTVVGSLPYVWAVEDLAPGAGGVITVAGRVIGGPTGSIFTNTASIGTLRHDSNSLDNSSAVSVTLANAPPVSADDVYLMLQDHSLMVAGPGVLSNDLDLNGDALTAVLVTSVATGTLELQPNGAFTFTPPEGFHGTVTFSYAAHDGRATSNAATVSISVSPVPRKLFLPMVRR